MQLRISAVFVAGALAATVSSLRPAVAEPMPARSVREDLTSFRDVWVAKEKSFTPEARPRMLAFVDRRIANPRAMERWALALDAAVSDIRRRRMNRGIPVL